MRQQSRADQAIAEIVQAAAGEISRVVRECIAIEIQAIVGETSRKNAPALASKRHRRVILCPVPKCGKPGGGPKYGWFCRDHKDLPKAERDAARAASRPRADVKAKASSARVKLAKKHKPGRRNGVSVREFQQQQASA